MQSTLSKLDINRKLQLLQKPQIQTQIKERLIEMSINQHRQNYKHYKKGLLKSIQRLQNPSEREVIDAMSQALKQGVIKMQKSLSKSDYRIEVDKILNEQHQKLWEGSQEAQKEKYLAKIIKEYEQNGKSKQICQIKTQKTSIKEQITEQKREPIKSVSQNNGQAKKQSQAPIRANQKQKNSYKISPSLFENFTKNKPTQNSKSNTQLKLNQQKKDKINSSGSSLPQQTKSSHEFSSSLFGLLPPQKQPQKLKVAAQTKPHQQIQFKSNPIGSALPNFQTVDNMFGSPDKPSSSPSPSLFGNLINNASESQTLFGNKPKDNKNVSPKKNQSMFANVSQSLNMFGQTKKNTPSKEIQEKTNVADTKNIQKSNESQNSSEKINPFSSGANLNIFASANTQNTLPNNIFAFQQTNSSNTTNQSSLFTPGKSSLFNTTQPK